MDTFAAELEDLDRRNRRKDLRKRLAEGPNDPWRASRHGPMREVILTANKEWFDHTDDPSQLFNTTRENQFEERAVAWLKEHFGDDVIHARADLDEQAYHIHAVILPRATVQKYGVECSVLQPSIHPLVKDYEAAQDSVGLWFAPLNLVRGERRKQAIRDALNNGKRPPISPRHVRPAQWRAMEEKRLADKAAKVEIRERAVVQREQHAKDIIAFAGDVADDVIDENGQQLPAGKPTQATGRTRTATYGFAAARKAFRAAAKRLRLRAQSEAEQKAKSLVAAETEEIRKADDILVEIAGMLPSGLREKIARARRRLTVKIMSLDRSVTDRVDGTNAPRDRS
jgi:hypothetical protein